LWDKRENQGYLYTHTELFIQQENILKARFYYCLLPLLFRYGEVNRSGRVSLLFTIPRGGCTHVTPKAIWESTRVSQEATEASGSYAWEGLWFPWEGIGEVQKRDWEFASLNNFSGFWRVGMSFNYLVPSPEVNSAGNKWPRMLEVEKVVGGLCFGIVDLHRKVHL
jgi:hypothetical protein